MKFFSNTVELANFLIHSNIKQYIKTISVFIHKIYVPIIPEQKTELGVQQIRTVLYGSRKLSIIDHFYMPLVEI